MSKEKPTEYWNITYTLVTIIGCLGGSASHARTRIQHTFIHTRLGTGHRLNFFLWHHETCYKMLQVREYPEPEPLAKIWPVVL